MDSLGILSVLTLIIALFYIEMKWGPDSSKTFSRLVARKRSSIIFYFIIFAIFLSVFSLFIITSFVPRLHLPDLFVWIYFIGVTGQLVCVSVPETGRYKTNIHIVAASVMSASVLSQLILLATYTQLDTISRIVCGASAVLMLAIWLIIIFKHTLMKHELALQSIYFACYLGSILIVSYLN